MGGEALHFGLGSSASSPLGRRLSDQFVPVPALPPNRRYIFAAAGFDHSILIRDDGVAVPCGDKWKICTVPELPAGVRYVSAIAGYSSVVLFRSDGNAVVA